MITIYTQKGGPNGWKVVMVMEALGLKYESKYLDFSKEEQKSPEHLKFNPNGRIPTIIDHDNNDFSLWESNSIIKYLVERYDKDNKIHFPSGTAESYLVDQWMTFQVSGQGPYFGQAGHFIRYHPIKVPTAIERYQKEVVRVISVLDKALEGKKFLVGDKLTIADISFIPWQIIVPYLAEGSDIETQIKDFRNYNKWFESVSAHPAVAKAIETRAKLLAE